MAVKIGHAVQDEKSKARGGVAGDQTAKEVCIWNWYNKPWTTVFRAKDKKVAEAIAKAMEQACENANIGYDQGQRTTLYTQAKAARWDLSKITTACECDCSALVAVCVNAAGVAVSKTMYTGNETTLLSATGAFDVLTDKQYLSSDDCLRRGDILLGKGHTAVVLTDGTSANKNTGVYTMEMRILKRGCKGEDVRALQILLTGRGYKDKMGEPDGVFGPNTQAAVRKYQRAERLTVDGIAGKKTMESLMGR